MTTVAAKTRYAHNDRETYVDVLGRVDVLSCFPDGVPQHPDLFAAACYAATTAVPLNDAPAGAFNRQRYVAERLQDAVEYRNKWYFANLPAEGRA